MGGSALAPDRASTPVATEYADDVAEAPSLGGDDDASETDEPAMAAADPTPDAQHDDAMGERYRWHFS